MSIERSKKWTKLDKNTQPQQQQQHFVLRQDKQKIHSTNSSRRMCTNNETIYLCSAYNFGIQLFSLFDGLAKMNAIVRNNTQSLQSAGEQKNEYQTNHKRETYNECKCGERMIKKRKCKSKRGKNHIEKANTAYLRIETANVKCDI